MEGELMITQAASILLTHFAMTPSSADLQTLLRSETQWHYSQHYLAECKGEQVIENMLTLTSNKKQRAILNSQLRDELRHCKLFQKQVDRIGFEPRAKRYAEGYSLLVDEQKSLSEKAFVFQILTESVSAGYCKWRLGANADETLKAVDVEVEADERKHLLMGKALLNICDTDEILEKLTPSRQRELVKKMNEICKLAIREDMVLSLLPLNKAKQGVGASSLDSIIAKSLINELRDFENSYSLIAHTNTAAEAT